MTDLYTIGCFGFSESAFFEVLTSSGIDTFCDIRRRRGVRGSEYAFVNSNKLQARLQDLGIRYAHRLDLAPPSEIRSIQTHADESSRTAKRLRTELSPEFIHAYRETCLSEFDSEAFITSLGPESHRAVLFCVEREPSACHRSLIAERITGDLGLKVTHLKP